MELQMWNQVSYDPHTYESNLIIAYIGDWKSQDFNGVCQVSGFMAQLIRASHGYRDVTGSNPIEVLTFLDFYIRNCLNCVPN